MAMNGGKTIIVLVDDEPLATKMFASSLEFDGFENVYTINDSSMLMPFLAEQKCGGGLILLDINMPGIDGTELLPKIKELHPGYIVIMVTAIQDIRVAIDCMKNGAADYLIKPIENSRLASTVRAALENKMLRSSLAALKETILTDEIKNPDAFSEIATISKKMHNAFRYVECIAKRSKEPILISGETGTGKELIARAIHKASEQPGEFVAVNTAGLDDTMFADTLFGHVKGAYTGAESARPGMANRAKGGTLFLDEIGDLSASSQVKLLRMLQDKEFFQLGSDTPTYLDTRVVLATHADLHSAVESGNFRRDLFYRINTHHVPLPPLRERKEDIPLLVSVFAATAALEAGRAPIDIHPDFIAPFLRYEFPGNLRELKSVVTDIVAKLPEKRHLDSSALPMIPANVLKSLAPAGNHEHKISGESAGQFGSALLSEFGGFPTIEENEDALIQLALKMSKNNITSAATLLGLTRQALYKKLKRKKSA